MTAMIRLPAMAKRVVKSDMTHLTIALISNRNSGSTCGDYHPQPIQSIQVASPVQWFLFPRPISACGFKCLSSGVSSIQFFNACKIHL